MNLPTDTLTLIDWLITIAVPIIAGVLVSRLLEYTTWFQSIQSKNAAVVAVSALLGFALMLLKNWLVANPAALSSIDPYVKMFLASLVMYLTTQIAHGTEKAKGLR